MVIEYCRPSWPEKHSPTPMEGPKNTKTVPDTFVYTRLGLKSILRPPWKAQKTQKRFLTPLFTHFNLMFRRIFLMKLRFY